MPGLCMRNRRVAGNASGSICAFVIFRRVLNSDRLLKGCLFRGNLRPSHAPIVNQQSGNREQGTGSEFGKAELRWPCCPTLGFFDQLHFAVALAVQHLHIATLVAEDEDLAVAELALFHGFLKRHRAKRN